MARYLGWAWSPVIASVVWTATILTLLILWLANGHPDYRNDEGSVIFISDIGAKYKPVFIAGACVTAFFYPLTLFAERWLRHLDRLPTTKRKREKASGIIAIIFSIYGSIALILLTIFDAFHYSTAHWVLTLIFALCVGISAISQAIEIFSLKKANPGIAYLKQSARVKLVLIITVMVCVLLFIILYGSCDGNTYGRGGPENRASYPHCNGAVSTAAVLEFTGAFLFSLYLITFVIDLFPYIERSTKKFGATTADMPDKTDAGVKPSEPKNSQAVPTS